MGPDRHRDELRAVHRIADRRRHHAAAGIEAPNLLQGPGIVGHKRALPETAEHQVAGGREHAGPVRQIGAHHCLDLPGHGIERLDAPVVWFELE